MTTMLWVFLGLCVLFAALYFVLPWYFRWHTDKVPPAGPGTHVACIGDSVTYGALILRRREKCYPAQLQRLLGGAYCVRNFGVNCRTLQRSADKPYRYHRHYRLSLDFAPAIVLIMLGTNDTKAHNWRGAEAYVDELYALIHMYRSLPSEPAVYVLTPPPLYSLHGRPVRFGMSAGHLSEITGAIRACGYAGGFPVIDINAALDGHPEYFPLDGVHPNAAGDAVIAQTVFKALTGKTAQTGREDGEKNDDKD